MPSIVDPGRCRLVNATPKSTYTYLFVQTCYFVESTGTSGPSPTDMDLAFPVRFPKQCTGAFIEQRSVPSYDFGVTASDGVDGVLVPTALWATTVKV